ncbi:hypothetical protein BH24DEI2_BH24DEI2_07430 [soil metagenome]
MGKNKGYRKRLASLESRLIEHYLKREAENAQVQPDSGLVTYWDKEIAGRLKEVNRLRSKLGLPERTA